MLLSVLSALARLDIDPWQEAAALARLPGEAATRRLASLMAELPEATAGGIDAPTSAARVIAFLPRRPVLDIASPGTLVQAGEGTKSRADKYAIYCAIFWLFWLGTHFIMASLQPSAPGYSPHMPASSSVAQPVPPKNANDDQVGSATGGAYDQ